MIVPHSRPSIEESDIAAVSAALRSGPAEPGRQVRRFEAEIARTVGQRHGVATSSGTAALHLALLALGVSEGDQVLLPSYVCTAVLNAVSYTRAAPILCDVEEETGTLDPVDARRRATPRTKAVIVPHLFGHPADLTRLQELGLPVIEDCAQALGATWQERPVGSFGLISVLSFHSTKVITTGEGGMACTSSDSLAERLRDLRNYDQREDYRVRYSYQLSDMQAGLGLAQLSRLPDMVARRRRLAARYDCALAGLGVDLPPQRPGCDPIHYRYVIRAEEARHGGLIELFAEHSVECKRPVFRPLHHYRAGWTDRRGSGDFPVHPDDTSPYLPRTDRFYARALSLPLYPALTDAEADLVTDAARAVLGAARPVSRAMVGTHA
jgi:dTDP-4-amino-4,6-dideoxygalactose transaminase